MNRFRLLVLVAGAVVVLVVLAVAVAFNSAFQTWAVRKAVASWPGMRASVGSVSAGTKRIVLKDLRFDQPGAVLQLPIVELELPVMLAGWDRKVEISRLVAKGWTLDLTRPALRPLAATPVQNTGRASAGVNTPRVAADAAAQVFAGILARLQLPIDLSLDGVKLEGDVILPDTGGRVKVTLSGGGLGAGREGKFDLSAEAALADIEVRTIEVRGAVVAVMDTPRTFTRLAAKLDATALGKKFPRGVKAHADVAVARGATGESYSAALIGEDQELIMLNATLPPQSRRYAGTWKVDFRDADVAPFLPGQPLPSFTAVGEGRFDGEAPARDIHAVGRLNMSLDRLQTMMPELAAIGELKIATDFDLAARAGTLAVEAFAAEINSAQPVATARALQPFEFSFTGGEVRAADSAREWLGVVLHALPVKWAAPFVQGVEISGGALRGELTALTRAGGLAVRSVAPILIDDIAVAQAGKPMLQRVDLALNASGNFTPRGWQADVGDLTARSGEITWLTLAAKVGRLAGKDQSLKAAGKLELQLPALLTQPVTANRAALTAGDAVVDFALSLNHTKEFQADIALQNLATVVDQNPVKLPSLLSHLRADISADGTIAFDAPIQIEREERKSDLAAHGTIGPEKDKVRTIDAEVTSTQFVVDDAKLLAAVRPARLDAKSSAPAAPRDTAPPWAGLSGSLGLTLKSVIYSDAIQVSNVTGRVRIDAGTLKLESLQAGLGDGRANLTGTVTFDAATPHPYALVADMAVREFDPAPLFRSLTGSQIPTVEGRFDVISKLAGRSATLGDLVAGADGNFQFTSKGGVFRGLPVNVGNIVENSSRLAIWIASAGSAISAIAGKKELADVANKAEAVAEVARGLNPIPYDQLSVVLSRDAALNTSLRNFTLIAPELRLTGTGTALHKPGSGLLDDPLVMDFTLRARGRQGELLKYLGALDPHSDDLGYATCTVPLKVSGTLSRPDTTELNGKLTALAIEKSGFGDKAAEFLAKIRGK